MHFIASSASLSTGHFQASEQLSEEEVHLFYICSASKNIAKEL